MSDESMLCKSNNECVYDVGGVPAEAIAWFLCSEFLGLLRFFGGPSLFRILSQQTRSRSPLSSCTIESHGLHDRHIAY